MNFRANPYLYGRDFEKSFSIGLYGLFDGRLLPRHLPLTRNGAGGAYLGTNPGSDSFSPHSCGMVQGLHFTRCKPWI